MFLKIIVTLCACISLVLYFLAPSEYSYYYGILCFGVYLVSTLAMLKNNCKQTWLKYELFFSIAFIFTNFILTTFYYHFDIPFLLTYHSLMPAYFNKGIVLSLIGGCFFNLGVFQKYIIDEKNTIVANGTKHVPRTLFMILMMIFLPYLSAIYALGYYTTVFEDSLINAVLVCVIYYSMYATCNNASFYDKTYNKLSKTLTPITILTFVYVAYFLLIGSRTIPLRVVLLTFFLFNTFIYSFSKKAIMTSLLVGAFMMAFVRVARTNGSLSEMGSILNLGDDLIVCNRCLHYAIDYVSKEGITWGLNLIITIAAIIPHGATILIDLFNLDRTKLSSATLITNSYNENDHGGLGTTLVADLYLAFGIIGVIVLMFLLGYVVRKLYVKVRQGNSRAILIYALLFMDVIYINRSSMFVSATFIAWTYFLYLIYNSKNK